jgi:hypothetical protein
MLLSLPIFRPFLDIQIVELAVIDASEQARAAFLVLTTGAS